MMALSAMTVKSIARLLRLGWYRSVHRKSGIAGDALAAHCLQARPGQVG